MPAVRRLIRIAFNTLTVLSIVPTVLVAVLWVRSHWYGDSIDYYRRPALFSLLSVDGIVAVAWGELESEAYPPSAGWHSTLPFMKTDDGYVEADLQSGSTAGFLYRRTLSFRMGYRQAARELRAPYWAIALPLLTATAFAVRTAAISYRRHRRGLCPTCGYDLRATPDRCPECGATKAQ